MALPASPRTAIGLRTGRGHRPTLFTARTRDTILRAIRKGMYPSEAASLAGLSWATVKGWLAKGYDFQAIREEGGRLGPGERAFADFLVAFQKAEAEHVNEALEAITSIGVLDRQWTALMTVLERRYPDRWKKREQTEVVGVGGGEIKVHVDNSPKALLEVLEVLRESGALAGLLESIGGNAVPSRAVIDAEAEQIHSSHADAEAAGGSAPPAH